MDGTKLDARYPDSNYHIAPGDILLLSSRGARSRGSLLQQAIERRGSRRFRHVAVVLNDQMVAQAMPQHGVTLRHWQDLLDHVDLAASRVARNRKLAHDPDAGPRIMQRANLFYKQRYDVQSVVRADTPSATPSCCQFVEALYDDLQQLADHDWPHTIASHTRDGAWRQFKLSEYGLAQPQHPLGASFYLNHFDETFSAKVPPALVQHLRTQRAASQFAARLHELALAIASLPRQMEPLREVLGTVSPPSERELPLGGSALESQWRRLFLDYQPGIPGFLHSAGQAGEHMPHMRRYARATGELLALAHLLHSALAMFQELAGSAQQLTRQGQAGVQQMALLCSQGEQLLACCAALCDEEPEDEVLMRVQNYPVLHAEVEEVEEMADLEAAALASSSLVALSELDLMRLDWAGKARQALVRTLSRLRELHELLR